MAGLRRQVVSAGAGAARRRRRRPAHRRPPATASRPPTAPPAALRPASSPSGPIRALSGLIDYFGLAIIAVVIQNSISYGLGSLVWLLALGWGFYSGYLNGQTGRSVLGVAVKHEGRWRRRRRSSGGD
ncbi:MAG: hypothetical protein R2711_02945 [Acidimicrobiales bacterium]